MTKKHTNRQSDFKKIIEECDFLEKDYRDKWIEKSDSMPEDKLEVVIRKIKDAKRKVENIYISIALTYSPHSKDLIKETLKTLQNVA